MSQSGDQPSHEKVQPSSLPIWVDAGSEKCIPDVVAEEDMLEPQTTTLPTGNVRDPTPEIWQIPDTIHLTHAEALHLSPEQVPMEEEVLESQTIIPFAGDVAVATPEPLQPQNTTQHAQPESLHPSPEQVPTEEEVLEPQTTTSSAGNFAVSRPESWQPPNTTQPAQPESPRQGPEQVPVADTTTSDVSAQMTIQVEPMIVPDLDITDEAYAESTSTSYVTSIASEISRGIFENERLYPQYGKHSYGMPIDEAEMDRMDLQHRKYEMVLGDRHFLAPIGCTPQRILDLATGTGIWALDVADMFPSAQVLGVDIAPIQPRWVAPNCQFEIDDIEDSWTYRKDHFDFIHCRDPLYVVRDWPKLMRQAYEHTKPGGWCELTSVLPRAMCDDGSMPEDSMFKFICDKFIEASYGLGAPLDCCLRFADYLRDAGFVDVVEHIFKMPSSPWPKDKRLKKIGALEMTNLVAGATGFGLRVFSHAYGWTREQTELAMVGFRRDVKNRNHHQYVQYFVVYGRKPLRE